MKSIVELTDIWIIKNELCTESVLNPIHCAANNLELCGWINENFDTILLMNNIAEGTFLNIFQIICRSTTSTVCDTDLDEFRLRLVAQIAQDFDGSWGEGNGLLKRNKVEMTPLLYRL